MNAYYQTPRANMAPPAIYHRINSSGSDAGKEIDSRARFIMQSYGALIHRPMQGETLDELDQLLDLPENWNGYQVDPPKHEAIAHAKQWLKDFSCELSEKNLAWLTPHVTANERGNVALEWHHGEQYLSVYISESEAYYIRAWGPDVDNEMEDGDAMTTAQRVKMWTLFQGIDKDA